jgi:hypothetical protein
MFCSACGTPNADDATSCRICGEALAKRGRVENNPKIMGKLRSIRWKTVWVFCALVALLAATGFGLYFYRSTQEFEVTGQLLYKVETHVRPVAGAQIQVFEDKGAGIPLKSRYQLVLDKQFELVMWSPESYDSKKDAEFARLNLPPLSGMDWTWWEIERLHNCSWAGLLFNEGLEPPQAVATTSTDMNGRFWLRLKRGKYFITAQSDVPSFWRLEHDPMHQSDTSQPVGGNAFWNIPVTVSGNLKLVSADPACSPDR